MCQCWTSQRTRQSSTRKHTSSFCSSSEFSMHPSQFLSFHCTPTRQRHNLEQDNDQGTRSFRKQARETTFLNHAVESLRFLVLDFGLQTNTCSFAMRPWSEASTCLFSLSSFRCTNSVSRQRHVRAQGSGCGVVGCQRSPESPAPRSAWRGLQEAAKGPSVPNVFGASMAMISYVSADAASAVATTRMSCPRRLW